MTHPKPTDLETAAAFTNPLPPFSVLLGVLSDEDLIRLHHRLQKLSLSPDALQWAEILSDELQDREN